MKNLTGIKKYNCELNKAIKESLIDALYLLLKNKSNKKITVTELCKKAGVSRVAFYNNFKTIDEVVNLTFYVKSHTMLEIIGNPFSNANCLDWYVNLFEEIGKNKEFFKILFDSDYQYRYLSIVNYNVLKHVANASEEEKTMRLLWAGAIVNRIIIYLKEGAVDNVNELAKDCFKYLSKFTLSNKQYFLIDN